MPRIKLQQLEHSSSNIKIQFWYYNWRIEEIRKYTARLERY
jgi:hypothetical protein